MDKQHILAEIRRTAKLNNGQPLGKRRFQAETGIKESDWSGKYWVRWGDAVQEAGLSPNTMKSSYTEDWLLDQLTCFIRELGHFPVRNEFRLKARRDASFPNEDTFKRLGNKAVMAAKIIRHCSSKVGYEDVTEICRPISFTSQSPEREKPESTSFGYVYLMKSGRYYKIGRSNSLGRREYELAIQLPDPVKTVHSIKTDDPIGIEEYWHKRFQAKRKGGEWFELSHEDIQAFRRRKFM